MLTSRMADCSETVVFRKDDANGQTSGEDSGDASSPRVPTPQKEATDATKSTSKWSVGSQCRATYSEDGLVYPAVILSVDGERYRVEFEGYGNEEDVDLSALLPVLPKQPWRDIRWALDSPCRAVWSEDGLVYPGVVVWLKGERCRVRFDVYENEEDMDVSALLPPEESQTEDDTDQQEEEETPEETASSSSDWRKKKVPEKSSKSPLKSQHSPMADQIETQACFFTKTIVDCVVHQLQQENELESQKQGQKEAKKSPKKSKSGSMPPFPFPFPPATLPMGTAEFPMFPPPPPPSFTCPPGKAGAGMMMAGGGDGAGDDEVASLSSMLLSWYLCGYHTGYYMGLQQGGAASDLDSKKKKKANERPVAVKTEE
ncbi:survival of motor neuron protein-like isoform X2 [Engraulis encrasicolus]|uniref:survival of motor neuron protein-like isoform X2 n=1 Tax=Engraulis encrasicolus TaxID=184585 RepID=UPI002FCF9E94